MLLDQLLRPFGYLAIRHPYKWVVDWLYPFLLMVVTVTLVYLLGGVSKVFDAGGLIALTLSFVQSLPGFYIAALAAIATFGRADIDSILPEPTPKIWIKFRGGADNLVSLTRRRFLAMLFAFLTAESIALILYSIFLVTYGSAIVAATFHGYAWGNIIGCFLVGLFFLVLYQMILATFWGLYYLGYKLHE